MHPLALLPFELVLAGLAAAQRIGECRDGLNQLYNKLGQSPCTVRDYLLQACNDTPQALNCTCNTVVYNMYAACALCMGDEHTRYTSWATNHTCGPSPMQFAPPTSDNFNSQAIPHWAYQPLTALQDFNVPAAVAQPDAPAGLSRGAQIAVPIAVAAGVALLAFLIFWFYWKRNSTRRGHYLSKHSLPPLPDDASFIARTQKWMRTLRYSMGSTRLRPTKRDTDFVIDDDMQGLYVNRASMPYSEDFVMVDRVQSPVEEAHDLGHLHSSSHIKETSSSSLLPRVALPEVHVPAWMGWFKGDSIKKSPSYKSKQVSRISPDRAFRIDGSMPSPTTARPTGQGHDRLPSSPETPDASGTSRKPPSIITSRSNSENITDQVIVISRTGEDFTMSPSTAPTLSSPRTPLTGSSRTYSKASTRQPPSAYSGAYTPTTPGASSWLPSPRRANTSSTVSGAYPHELWRDPDLTSPPNWANKFPPPPQHFPPLPQMPFSSGTVNNSGHPSSLTPGGSGVAAPARTS